ncbi:tripartite tricarboxylate transporter permease [Marinivivus vitaminiproducens]|uniref:tripartite tricarboxylate transporter permease n=1 Tax=Marinivivus vitaminiproducens TaxID=3035935 RepID=UPI0027996CE3|nr:tripartite tricarboxylate transporter permease [Geminicoccaceae bacterium SCSIO 64248]
MATLQLIGAGLASALSPYNLLFCFLGVLLGTAVGVLPGFGPLAAISLLLPITFHLEPSVGLIMLAGIYYGSQYGGSITSILLNIPGEASSAVTCLDGHPLARQGRAGAALFLTTFASFLGGSVGIVLIMGFSPLLAQMALSFSSVDYFSMMLFGLIVAATLSVGSPFKGLIMVVIGLLLALVGTDATTGTQRFTFGLLQLEDGLNLAAIAIGLFGISEIFASVGASNVYNVDPRSITLRSLMPTRAELSAAANSSLRGSAIGSLLGVLPGAGPALSSFVAYAAEKRLSKTPARFGRGAVEGLAAPEAANNAAAQTAFIPTLSLGIPGSATLAVMLGALMYHNVTPGPQFIVQYPDLFWTLVMSFWVGNIILVILNIPFIGLWVRMLATPYGLLFPAMLVFICIGAFSVSNSTFDVGVALISGIIGYGCKRYGYPGAPLLLAFILEPLMEQNLRRALLISDGDPGVFFTRPLSASLLVAALLLLLVSVLLAVRDSRTRRAPA